MRVRDALGISAKAISLVLLVDFLFNVHRFGAFWTYWPDDQRFDADEFIWNTGFLFFGAVAGWWFARWLRRNPCPPALEGDLTPRTLLALMLAVLGSYFIVQNLWSTFEVLKNHVDFEGHVLVTQPDFRVAFLQLFLGASVLMFGLIGWRGATLDRA